MYRDRLLRMHRRTTGDDYAGGADASGTRANQAGADPNTYIDVDIAHVGEYDSALLGLLLGQPSSVLASLELAAADALRTLLFDLRAAHNRGAGAETGEEGGNLAQGAGEGAEEDGGAGTGDGDGGLNPDANPNDGSAIAANDDEYNFSGTSIQILLRGNLTPTALRSIQSKHMNTLLRCPGIVISASRVRSRAHIIKVRCSRCMDERIIHSTTGPFGGVALPQRCQGE